MENLCNSFALCIGCPSGQLNQDNKEIHRDNHVLVAKKMLSCIWIVAILVVICAHKEIKGMQRRDIAQKMRHGG